jgi:hypothetical protein
MGQQCVGAAPVKIFVEGTSIRLHETGWSVQLVALTFIGQYNWLQNRLHRLKATFTKYHCIARKAT